ncbi:hypothetical protein JAAARDRAFT_603629 [Jaapia argillacea MUCL 33604]|uniref:Uncharacterized protein n=1 Tax=Jaapia argillacea MUCL 33604 TaxID=933084 RepID=A0A067Q033_9AGAM|nr:hypothetical protein JAAARDRAFT_603629 [Jaapia argillacea MUCL 33604]
MVLGAWIGRLTFTVVSHCSLLTQLLVVSSLAVRVRRIRSFVVPGWPGSIDRTSCRGESWLRRTRAHNYLDGS